MIVQFVILLLCLHFSNVEAMNPQDVMRLSNGGTGRYLNMSTDSMKDGTNDLEISANFDNFDFNSNLDYAFSELRDSDDQSYIHPAVQYVHKSVLSNIKHNHFFLSQILVITSNAQKLTESFDRVKNKDISYTVFDSVNQDIEDLTNKLKKNTVDRIFIFHDSYFKLEWIEIFYSYLKKSGTLSMISLDISDHKDSLKKHLKSVGFRVKDKTFEHEYTQYDLIEATKSDSKKSS